MYKQTLRAGRMLFGPGSKAAMQRANQPEMKHSRLSYHNNRAPISNDEVKNIGSAGYIQLIFERTVIKNQCVVDIADFQSKIKKYHF